MTRTQEGLVYKAWKYLYDSYGPCEDICGDICNTELFLGLLDGTKTKTDCRLHMLQRYYDTGNDDGNIPKEDRIAQEFFMKLLNNNLIT
jgi:hypothetical protein